MKTPRFLKAHMRELLLMLLDSVTVTVLYTICFYISRVYDLFDFRNPLEVWGRYLIIILPVYLLFCSREEFTAVSGAMRSQENILSARYPP